MGHGLRVRLSGHAVFPSLRRTEQVNAYGHGRRHPTRLSMFDDCLADVDEAPADVCHRRPGVKPLLLPAHLRLVTTASPAFVRMTATSPSRSVR
jgi:hypothetical protein